MKKLSLFIFVLLLSLQAIAQDDIEVVNIENPAVQAYLDDSTYFQPDDNYSKSIIQSFANSSRYGSELDRPRGKKVNWSLTAPSDSVSEVVISVSEHADYKDCWTFYPEKKASTSYEIRNLIPNRVYYYKVEEVMKNGEVEQLKSGVFRTVGRLRMIQVDGVHNVRDLGGWPTQFGVPVKYGMLYRSGNLDHIKSTGRHLFADNLNVGAELDLRSESRLKSSPLGDDKALLVLAHSSYLSGMKNKNYLYPKDLHFIVENLKKGVAVDWHCAIGCDRCGTVSFLIDGLLGLDEVDLGRDYELSTLANHKRPRTSVKSMISYIKTFGTGEETLAECFYKYWLSIGADEEDMKYLIANCLDYPEGTK